MEPMESYICSQEPLEPYSKQDVCPLAKVLMSGPFLRSFRIGLVSGAIAYFVKYMDQAYGDFLPASSEPVVFNVFIVFASLVAAFRTSHALVRYMEAAGYLHKLAACHFDVACTLLTFCRVSDASLRDINEFQQTVLRLLSMLNALALAGLEKKMTKVEVSHRFEVLGWEHLSSNVRKSVMTMDPRCKVEYVVQLIHQLVVDNMKLGVLNIAPPILTRAFQELGIGVLTYHEAKKLSCVPLPYAYHFLTRLILVTAAIFVPYMLAIYSQGAESACVSSFFGMFLLWYLNEVADSLDNPFRRESSSLDPPSVQAELNMQLWTLLTTADDPTPAMCEDAIQSGASVETDESGFFKDLRVSCPGVPRSITECFVSCRSDVAYDPAFRGAQKLSTMQQLSTWARGGWRTASTIQQESQDLSDIRRGGSSRSGRISQRSAGSARSESASEDTIQKVTFAERNSQLEGRTSTGSLPAATLGYGYSSQRPSTLSLDFAGDHQSRAPTYNSGEAFDALALAAGGPLRRDVRSFDILSRGATGCSDILSRGATGNSLGRGATACSLWSQGSQEVKPLHSGRAIGRLQEAGGASKRQEDSWRRLPERQDADAEVASATGRLREDAAVEAGAALEPSSRSNAMLPL